MRPVQQAQVVYDSGRTGDSVGLRGGPAIDRSLIFIADAVSMDLMVQTRPREDHCYLCGQVLDSQQETSLPGVEVRIGDERAYTDAFGQFAVGGQWPPEDRVITVNTEEADVVCIVPDLD